MAELKNQHFVPKVHLREFSDDEGGGAKTINLVNVERDKAIRSASLAGQCAKHYFYGKNLKIEKGIGKLEGDYGNAIRRLKAGDKSIGLLKTLRWWAHFQYLRTDSARRRFRAFHDNLNAAIQDPNWQINISDEELIVDALRLCFETQHLIEDLTPTIIVNASVKDFVTSDAPSVVFNKWYSQKLGRSNFGMSSSGVCLYMPLTPRFGLICYDANVYSVNAKASCFTVNSDKEIDRLNSLLFRADARNIYFRDWLTHEAILEQAEQEKPFRSPASRVEVLVPIDGFPGSYRALAADENPKDFTESVIHSESVYPTPSEWFNLLKNKVRPVTYSNGSAVGFVRKKAWLRVNGMDQPMRSSAKTSETGVLPGLPQPARR